MNKEAVEKRIAELDKQKADIAATYQAINGAQNELRFWLQRMELQEQQPACS